MTSVRTQTLRAQPVTELAAYLLGSWQLSREIIDHRSGRLNLEGSAEVTRRLDGTLVYTEHGMLATGVASLEFTRSYRYLATGAGTARVQFEDGSPFYDLDLSSGRCRVRHNCDEDLYLGFILSTNDGWYTRWRCRGPQKDYVATTRLSRSDVVSPPESIA
jgi:hypothetical protein